MNEPSFARGLEVRPVVANILKGIEYLEKGNRDQVHAAFADAIRIAEREVSPQERPFIPFAHDMYSASLWAIGDHEEAAEHHRIAVDTARKFGLKGRITARENIMDSVQNSLKQMFMAAPGSAATR